jgi:hypothetical protein
MTPAIGRIKLFQLDYLIGRQWLDRRVVQFFAPTGVERAVPLLFQTFVHCTASYVGGSLRAAKCCWIAERHALSVKTTAIAEI